MADEVAIKLHHGVSPYQAGETAGFDRNVADAIVQRGWGEYVHAKDVPAVSAPVAAEAAANGGDGEPSAAVPKAAPKGFSKKEKSGGGGDE